MMKRGQAALEFLMTYGWAILVVLAAIAALAYFGVLSPDRFLPEKCTMPSGLACLDFRATGSGVDLILQNSFGFDMNTIVTTINGTGCNAAAAGPASLINGNQGTYTAICSPSQGKFKGEIIVTYVNQGSGLSHSKTGEIIVQIP